MHNTSGDPVLVHVDRVEVVPYGAYVLMVPPTDQRNPHLEAAYPVAEAYVPDAKEQGWRTQTEFSPPIYAEVQGRALAVRGKGSHGTVFSLDHVSAVRVKEFSAAKTTLLVIGCLAGAAAIGFAAAGVVSYVNHLSWGPT